MIVEGRFAEIREGSYLYDIVEKLHGLTYSMSYNETYFGEKEGELKGSLKELFSVLQWEINLRGKYYSYFRNIKFPTKEEVQYCAMVNNITIDEVHKDLNKLRR